MTYIEEEYIKIDWMYKWLTDQLYDRKIDHETMRAFYRMRAEWIRKNERENIQSENR